MRLTNLPFPLFGPNPTSDSSKERPGLVTELCGIVFQCDASSLVGDIFIRPIEVLDLWLASLGRREANAWRAWRQKSPLGMHAGLHVVLDDGSHFVVEQLTGGWREWLVNGLHWTPLEAFREREKRGEGGWDVTVAPEAFRQVDEFAKKEAVHQLNRIRGRAFLKEDCTAFIGRVFGSQRRIFADSPILRSLGVEMRSGEPALPLLRRDGSLTPEAESRLHGAILRALPDPKASSASISLRQLHHRVLIGGAVVAAITFVICAILSATRALKVVGRRPE
jgi:hypothetical protein